MKPSALGAEYDINASETETGQRSDLHFGALQLQCRVSRSVDLVHCYLILLSCKKLHRVFIM